MEREPYFKSNGTCNNSDHFSIRELLNDCNKKFKPDLRAGPGLN